MAEALRDQILSMVCFPRGRGGQIIAELIGEGQRDPELIRLFRKRFLAERRVEAVKIIERGVAQGGFATDLDVELAIDLYAGPIYYRLLVGHSQLSDTFAEGLAGHILSALRNQGHSWRAPLINARESLRRPSMICVQ